MQLLEIIYAAIDDINRQNPGHIPIPKTRSTVLFGNASALDSLGLINLVVNVEQRVEQELGAVITLADDRALSQDPSPFSTVEALANYIDMLMKEKQHA